MKDKAHPMLVAAFATPLLVMALVGCGQQQDPCRDEIPADQALIDQVRDNPEIEVETPGYNDAECILTPAGNWVDEATFETEEDGD